MLEIENADQLITEAMELGRSFLEKNRPQDAELVLKQVLKVKESPRAWQLLGLAKYACRKYDEAIDIFNKLLFIDPNNAEHHNNLSLAYFATFQINLAKIHLEAAIRLDPYNSNYFSNLGLQYRASNELDQAIQLFKTAIELDPKNHFAWVNLGSAYGRMKNIEEAIHCLQHGSELDPTNKHTRVNLAYAYLLQGNWEKGWAEYENRIDSFKQLEYFKQIYNQKKQWHGTEDLHGKRIAIYGEQGVGDVIQFSRFLPILKERGGEILLHVSNELVSLFVGNTHLGVSKVSTVFRDSDYDFFCSIMSLPYLLQLNNMGVTTKYLSPPAAVHFDNYRKYYKVGIVWAGNPQHPNDSERSCFLSNFKALQLPGVKLFSLQKDVGKRMYWHSKEPIDLAEDCEDMTIVDMSPHLTDFEKTAMIIAGLDLVVTVDTAILHLAGAIGKETWGLIPYNPDWRWGLEGEDTIWYPSVRLLRQIIPGDWASVFLQAQTKLKERLL